MPEYAEAIVTTFEESVFSFDYIYESGRNGKFRPKMRTDVFYRNGVSGFWQTERRIIFSLNFGYLVVWFLASNLL